MALVEKVKAILTAGFPPPAKVHLEDDDGIIGWVASPTFVGMDHIDRVDLIWKVLNEKLTKEERRRVVVIAAVTPVEEIVYSA